jgi:RNA polymerase sigma factor (sigma-70 family)
VAWRTDADVIVASRTEPAVFAEIYDRHAGAIVRYLVRRVGGDGEELLGEVFRIAFERRASFDRSRPDAAPWLYGIAANLVAKHRRAAGRRARALARLDHDRPDDGVERVVAIVDADRRWPGVAAMVRRLPPGEREALLLFAWEDQSYEQIAVALGIPVGTVRSRLNRARRRLREPPAGDGGTMGDPPRRETAAESRRMDR